MMRIAETARTVARPSLSATRRFRRDEGASLSVEAALIAPLLFWAFLATFTYFDAYRVRNLSLKANYAISDLLSRETNVIDSNYITGSKNLFRYLTKSDSSAWVRVSVVHCVDGCAVKGGNNTGPRELAADWSRASDDIPILSDADINDQLDSAIPLIASGERVIIVETAMNYQPAFSPTLTGIGDQTFTEIVMTRPRFASQLCFAGVGCGL